ncbi:MFS transporter [Lacipirellula parvula]|uniref:MFS transporter n=1 Tax=Lacipirellula parvula TaxID=2650471 RepID=UPI00126088AD|nr:MFS transporter [Lacipirellula parvula]
MSTDHVAAKPASRFQFGAVSAVFSAFLIDGAGFGAWAALLPVFKSQLSISDGQLSVALFSMVIGSVAAMPIAGRFIAHLGSRRVIIAAAVAYSILLPLVAFAASPASTLAIFAIGALITGAAKGSLDVSVNAQAIAIENHEGRPIVARCHGGWSMGALTGSLFVAGGLKLSLGAPLIMTLLGLLLLGLAAFSGRRLTEHDRPDEHAHHRHSLWPRGRLAPLAALAFIALFCEGSMADWSAVFLADVVGAEPASAALGFATYATAMTASRFCGDQLSHRLGPVVLMRFSGAVAALGLALSLASQTYWLGLLGFAMAGFGLANIIPALFRAAARHGHAGPAIASVSTVGYVGLLIGPPIIGALSRTLGLPLSLGLLVLFSGVLGASANLAKPRGTH